MVQFQSVNNSLQTPKSGEKNTMFQVIHRYAGSALCHTREQAEKLAQEIFELFALTATITEI